VWELVVVVPADLALDTAKSFDNNSFDISPHLVNILPSGAKMLEHCGDVPLVRTLIILILRLNKLLVVLV
jgi:hypothetical protein